MTDSVSKHEKAGDVGVAFRELSWGYFTFLPKRRLLCKSMKLMKER